MKRSARVLIWGLAMLSGGCATQSLVDDVALSGQVGVRDITGLVPLAARMELADHESFLMPLDDHDNAMPVYPESLLARRLPPQALCLRVSIGVDGAVMASAPIDEGAPACPDIHAIDAAFFHAAQTVVSGWRFDPALRCVFPTVAAKEHVEASCSGGEEVPVPVSLAYRFVFEQRDGHGSVRIGK
ncbi:hypothetical protein ACFQZQ_14270 [Lysobacter koreensis]|uniref:Lipoprotein n=1 Tax=Lysobacter koreensis TaxID=266122 RepID=A0ABW2YVE4_9GAMM